MAYLLLVLVLPVILPKDLGKLSLLFFDFQVPGDLFCVHPEAHGSDLLFVDPHPRGETFSLVSPSRLELVED